MLKLFFRFVVVLVILWVTGYVAFSQLTMAGRYRPLPPPSEAIVALTGGTGERIASAVALLEAERAPLLFISGVNPVTTKDDLVRLSGGNRDLFVCCVELGHRAQTTLGNAVEIADWTRSKNLKTLIVVTSDYHMPRAVREMQAELGAGVRLHRWPVGRANEGDWWRNAKLARRLLIEYVKFQIVLARDIVTGISELLDQDAA
jgi:uncharacterized SAM-binding protein YcdF (DUF218 family)